MDGMMLNYVLLVVTGQYVIRDIYAMVKGGCRDTRLLRPLFMIIVFVLVLIATVMGIGYMEFKTAIETGNWEK